MIRILFEDDDVLAVDKSEGLASIPERVRGKENLLDMLFAARGQKLYVIHRIDKEASGVILFAKNAEAHRILNGQFETRSIRKTYSALTHGVIPKNSGFIESPLRPFGSGRVAVDLKRGKACKTEYEVEKRFACFTLVRVHPLTGRRHQIRVHLYSIGHPIVGDKLYGDREIQKGYPRLMLHARRIAWQALSGEKRFAEADLPDSFNKVILSVSRKE